MAAQTFTAVFNGSTDTVSVSFTGVKASSPVVIPGDAVLDTAGGAFVVPYVDGAPTISGCTVKASAAFTGKVNLLVFG